jgi:hypothetical protein
MSHTNRNFLWVPVLLLATLLSAMYFLDRELKSNIDLQVRIARNIGEILRLDEVLTMSARMHAATQARNYRDRYFQNVAILDSKIKDTFQLFETEEARAAVHATDAANRALVQLEEDSFKLADAKQWSKARTLLESKEYLDLKQKYSLGMDQAFQLLQSAAATRTAWLRAEIAIGVIVFITTLLLLSVIWLRVRDAEGEIERKKAQYDALRVTMTTVMDTFNNALNNLLLIRMRAAEPVSLTTAELELFDSIIADARDRLRAMGSMQEFKSRRLGLVEILDLNSTTSKAQSLD